MPTKNAAQVMEEVARRWASMDEDLKDPYKLKAQMDKARYDKELEQYRSRKQQEKQEKQEAESVTPETEQRPVEAE